MTMGSNIEMILGKLPEAERNEVFQFAGMLTDPLTRRIMAKLASLQSPISTDSVPVGKLEGDKGTVISRLSNLERVGLVRSEKTPAENGFCKKYFINEKGKKFVAQYMQSESKLYA